MFKRGDKVLYIGTYTLSLYLKEGVAYTVKTCDFDYTTLVEITKKHSYLTCKFIKATELLIALQ
jgi:hypothetical protein